MVVGIEISPNALRAARLKSLRSGREPDLVAEVPLAAPASQAISREDALSEPLGRLVRQVNPAKGRVAVAIPSSWCHFRAVAFPYRTPSRVEGTLQYALEGRLPGPVETFVIEPVTGILPSGAAGSRLLLAAFPKDRMKSLLAALGASGVEPCVVQPSIVALAHYLHMTAALSPDRVALLLHLEGAACDVALVRDGQVVACQAVRLGALDPRSAADAEAVAGRIRFVVRAFEVTDGAMTADRAVLIAPDSSRAVLSDPLARSLGLPVQAPAVPASAVAVGVALDAARRTYAASNLRGGEYAYRPYAGRMERRAAVGMALCAGILLFIGVHLARSAVATSAQIRTEEQREKELFVSVTGMTNATPNIATMKSTLKVLQEQASRTGRARAVSCLNRWLELAKLVTESEKATFQSIDINPQRLKVTVKAPDSASADQVKRRLESSPAFVPLKATVTAKAEGRESFCVLDMEMGYKP